MRKIMREVVLTIYSGTFLSVLCSVLFVRAVMKKTRWVKWEKAAPDMKAIIKRNERKINKGINILATAVLIFMYLYRVIPSIQDIPNILNKDYLTAEGEVVSWDYSDETKRERRSIGILDSATNKEVSVVVYSTGIHKGDYISVTYLPHSEMGVINR